MTAAAKTPRDEGSVTTKTWTEDDPEPDLSVRAVVDEDGVTWARCRCNVDFPEDPPSRNWHQHLITHRQGSVLGGSIENTWRDVWGSVAAGSVLREATADEADTWIEEWS